MTGRCMSRKDGSCCRLHAGHRDSHTNWYGESWDDGDAAVADCRPADAPPDYKALYFDLLYQVATKHPGETRHETARRYLRTHEDRCRKGGPAEARGRQEAR